MVNRQIPQKLIIQLNFLFSFL